MITMFQSKLLAVQDFMSKKAPPNYIAGLGRGATGFTTRSDIGPAREASDVSIDKPLPGVKEATDPYAEQQNSDDGQETFQDPNGETGLFSTAPYEADDEEADRVYESIDMKLDERRRARRESRERQELEKYRRERPKIHQSFTELKRALSTVTEEEWSAIPEVGDLVRQKGKKLKQPPEKYTPIPSSILLGIANQAAYTNTIDPSQQLRGGFATPFEIKPSGTESAAQSGVITDFTQFGQARDKVLGLRLDKISDSVSGNSTVDPKGYLTDLNSIVLKTDSEINDIKKARLLLKSVITTNPKHASGWLAASRLEEFAGKPGAAREVIARGCEECPTSEDVWLEAARLNTRDNAKVILAKAIQHVPLSIKIWLRASELETEISNKKRVLIRALEFIPNSLKLWKEVVSLEADTEDARILLYRATQCVPQAVELWLALVRLETYDVAKKLLNDARRVNPTSREIWITAAKLEETQGNTNVVQTLISRALHSLRKMGATMDRDPWIKDAETAEREGYDATCEAIIKEVIDMGLNEDELKHTWMEDAENCIKNGSISTARYIYSHALSVFPAKKGIWRRAAQLEKQHGTRESFEEILERAVRYCPQAEILWLMHAKEKWLAGDIPSARQLLSDAFEANPNSESIWLAAIKLEVETGEHERARKLLSSARSKAGTVRVWMKSAVLERQLKNYETSLELLDRAIELFPDFDKLYMIKGQIEYEELQLPDTARKTYSNAVKVVPKSITLWLLAARLEIKENSKVKARAILEKARIMNPKSPELWAEAVRVELSSNNYAMAKTFISKALQECPTSGLLLSEFILMEPRPKRRTLAAEALKRSENAPEVIVTIAKLFASERKIEKARNWFSRAAKTNPDWGDCWAWWMRFELDHGTEESRRTLIDSCVAAEPRHGEYWQSFSKDIHKNFKDTEDILKAIALSLPSVI